MHSVETILRELKPLLQYFFIFHVFDFFAYGGTRM
ncbi:hypothetical protein NEOC95_002367 [Neochlamydia sp. AcF95]|nr:hypothetical protein [Neochlamydia sp. AcF95]